MRAPVCHVLLGCGLGVVIGGPEASLISSGANEMHALSTNTPMIDMSSSQISADALQLRMITAARDRSSHAVSDMQTQACRYQCRYQAVCTHVKSIISGPCPRRHFPRRMRRVPRRDIRRLRRSVAVHARAKVHLCQTRVSCCKWIAASPRVTPI